jgi:RimJ/RimL family protein N-acetyltransferase
MDDADSIFERYAKDPDVTRYLSWQPHERIEQTRDFVSRCIMGWEDGSVFAYVITLKEEDHPIGTIEIRIEGHRGEIGFALVRTNWGNGYMTEAAQAVTDWALEQEGVYRVQACCDLENQASARVLEKIGMQREGILRRWGIHPNLNAKPRDVYLYARVK